MRRHQAVGAAHPVVPIDHLAQHDEEVVPVALRLKERTAGDRTSRDVVRGAGDLKTGWSGHGSTIRVALRANAGGAGFGTKLCELRYGV